MANPVIEGAGRRTFAEMSLDGFCSAYGAYVQSVPGGLVRSILSGTGKVAVVSGGGSGHYPAFWGYVGQGLLDATVVGDVFASPSASRIVDVCRHLQPGSGILMCIGNYAGDVINFSEASERLRVKGFNVELATICDDVASAPPESRLLRRGIAGSLAVLKVAGAAAQARWSLPAVARVTRRAIGQTVSLGVAFSGCTPPGRSQPLFELAPGRMALGIGVHGEPGVEEMDRLPPETLSGVVVDRLLREMPEGVVKVAPIVNGLGATAPEELFLLWGLVERRLRKEGLEPILPAVGVYMTSFDTAGFSLSLLGLDEELERLWRAPCNAPVLTRKSTGAASRTAIAKIARPANFVIPPARQRSRRAAVWLVDLFDAIACKLEREEETLSAIDAVAGDGDHGRGMKRGAAAAAEAARRAATAGAGIATTLSRAADAWPDTAGGTSGALWGFLLRAWSKALSDDCMPATPDIVYGARLALAAVRQVGGARPGDKTMVDAIYPFTETLGNAVREGRSLAKSWELAAAAADDGAESTINMAARVGRARPLAALSLGHPDPGAVSFAMLASVAAAKLNPVS